MPGRKVVLSDGLPFSKIRIKPIINRFIGLVVAPLCLCVLALSSCTNNNIYEAQMGEQDYKLQKEGFELHCTEVLGEKCITHQWVDPDTEYTYRTFGSPEELEVPEPEPDPEEAVAPPSCVAEWCDLPIQNCSLPPLTNGTDSCGKPCSKPSVEWPNCIQE